MTAQKKTTVHGSAVALQGKDFPPSAVLLRGPSGSGKSDLCLRLIAAGGLLLCDDQVVLERRLDKLMAAAADPIRGLLEVRGVGLLRFPVAPPAPLCLVVDLVPRDAVPRLPERETADILGVATVRLKLYAFDASAPFKILKAAEVAHTPGLAI